MSIVLNDALSLRELDPRKLSDVSLMNRRLSRVVENLMSNDSAVNHTKNERTVDVSKRQSDAGVLFRKISKTAVDDVVTVNSEKIEDELMGEDSGIGIDSSFSCYSADESVNLKREMEACSMSKKEGILLTCVLISYLVIGALVFKAFEAEHEQDQRRDVVKRMQEVDQKLFQADRHNFTRENLRSIINELANARSLGLIDRHGNQTHAKWDFANSVFFAVTVVTTIGYGHLYPATPFGRTFCVLYGILGIPFTGILLASIGDHFSILLMRALSKAKQVYSSKLAVAISTLSVFIPWLLVFVFLPGGLFMMLEDWSYDVSLYYSFVTLAMIGFGDFVAATKNVDYIWLYKIMLIAWIIFGLGYLLMILNFISKAMQSKKLKRVEDRISEKINSFKVAIDNSQSRKQSSASLSQNTKSSSISDSMRYHRRSKSLDFDIATFRKARCASSPKWHDENIAAENGNVENADFVADKKGPHWKRFRGLKRRIKGSLRTKINKGPEQICTESNATTSSSLSCSECPQ